MNQERNVTVLMPYPSKYIADGIKLALPLYELEIELHGLCSKLFGSTDKPANVPPMTAETAHKIAKALYKAFPLSIAGGNTAQLLAELTQEEQDQLHDSLSRLPNNCYRSALHLFPSTTDEHPLEQSFRESSVFALLPVELGDRLVELLSSNLLVLGMGWLRRVDDRHPGSLDDS